VNVACQVHGERVSAEGITEDGWSSIPELGGYISNIYIDLPQGWLPGVPECAPSPSPSPPPRPPGAQPAGNVQEWIQEAFRILEQNGYQASALNASDVAIIIQHESSGNPRAVNGWDSNAKKGDPTRGLMQTTGATFNQYKLPGHDDIYNPVDNIIAGVRYAIGRYGSLVHVPGIIRVHAGQSYVGY